MWGQNGGKSAQWNQIKPNSVYSEIGNEVVVTVALHVRKMCLQGG